MKPHELITLKLRSGNYGTLKQELHLDAAEEIDRKAAQLAGAHHDAAAALALVADLDAANVELAREREQLRAKLDELTADRDEIHRALLMTTDERNRGDRELHRLRAQLDEYERAPQPPHVDPDWLANVIRTVDGDHAMGAGTLAEKIADAINGRTK